MIDSSSIAISEVEYPLFKSSSIFSSLSINCRTLSPSQLNRLDTVKKYCESFCYHVLEQIDSTLDYKCRTFERDCLLLS